MQQGNPNNFRPNLAAPEQAITYPAAAATLLSLVSGGALHADTTLVILSVETQAMRICPTGGVPSATVGARIEPGQFIELTRTEADAAKVLRVAAGSIGTVFQYKNS